MKNVIDWHFTSVGEHGILTMVGGGSYIYCGDRWNK